MMRNALSDVHGCYHYSRLRMVSLEEGFPKVNDNYFLRPPIAATLSINRGCAFDSFLIG